MPEATFSIRVKRMTAQGGYGWVIMQWLSAADAVELGSSSVTFDRPSQAMLAGEKALLMHC